MREDHLRVTRAERTRLVDELRQDLLFGARQLLRDRAFSALVILTLAIAITGNTTVFTLLDGLFLRPLPFRDEHELVSLNLRDSGHSYAPSILERIAQRTERALELAGWSGWAFTLTGNGPAETLDGAAVTTNLFDVLGARALLGRTFVADDRVPGQRVAVLSYALWQRRFGGDPSVIDRTIALHDGSGVGGFTPIPVVGVMPPEFAFPSRAAELWLPIVYHNGEAPSGFSTQWVARLRPGVTRGAALMQIPLLHGRSFDARDDENTPGVALVSRTLVDRVFPGEDPIGKRVRTGFERDWVTIVGVVGDMKDQSLAGVVIGMAGAVGLTHILRAQLYGVEPLDVRTFVGAGLLILVFSVAATLAPARRAARTSGSDVSAGTA